MTHKGKAVQIRQVAFPVECHNVVYGFLTEDQTGYYIYIDKDRHPLQKRRALGHELAHLFLDHLEQDPTIITTTDGQTITNKRNKAIETEANREAWKYYRLYKAGQLSD